MDRRGAVGERGFRHGTDDERDGVRDALESVPEIAVVYAVQRWEVEEYVMKQGIPAKLEKTAIYAAMGFGQEDSALLQGCSSRTVRNRLVELREWLMPDLGMDVHYVVAAALREALEVVDRHSTIG